MGKEFENLSKTQTFLFGVAMGFMLGGIFMMVALGWEHSPFEFLLFSFIN